MATKKASKSTDLRKGLSKKEAVLLSSLSEMKKHIILLDDIIKDTGCSYNYAKVIASRLIKKKWLVPIERGRYLIAPLEAGKRSVYTEHEYAIASVLANPYYIAYWSALNYHGLTEQVTFTVFIATTKQKRNKKIHGVSYRFVTLSRNKFFGYATKELAGKQVNISDIEKTIIDCLDHPEYCGGITEAAKAMWNARNDIDFKKLVGYAEKMHNQAIFKRLGYLLQKLKIETPDKTNKRINENISKGYSVLDPSSKKEGIRNRELRLLVNVSDLELLEWREIH